MTGDQADKMIDCPVMATVDVVGGKWKPRILWLLRQGKTRFGVLQRGTGASTRMLTKSLKELEDDALIARTIVMVGNVVTAEYAFTDHGRSLIPVLDAMGHWGAVHAAYRQI
jgi:DNA-binding HxlR family transcriptional regulator